MGAGRSVRIVQGVLITEVEVNLNFGLFWIGSAASLGSCPYNKRVRKKKFDWMSKIVLEETNKKGN